MQYHDINCEIMTSFIDTSYIVQYNMEKRGRYYAKKNMCNSDRTSVRDSKTES